MLKSRGYIDLDAENTVIVWSRIVDMDKMRAFTASDVFKQDLVAAGVVGEPEIWYTKESPW
jgi:hypothetical protein